ncbi:MAG: type IV pilin-like G/H family protein [Elusimicrobiaceae bacterium]|nr:type IV pilin-like G/H family protein [Elusimicrobiaceae bacterium]
MTILKSVKEAQERYYLANGQYATGFDELHLEVPGRIISYAYIKSRGGWNIIIGAIYSYAQNKSNTNTLVFYNTQQQEVYNGLTNLRECHAKRNDTVANQVCKSMGGSFLRNSTGCSIGSCTVYKL